MTVRTPTLLAAALLSVAAPVHAAAAVKVVTTTEGLAALAREVGGDRVQAEFAVGIHGAHPF